MLDSATDYTQYIDRAKELGQKAICFTEHGKTSGWASKKMYCDKVGIKYLHGVECYLTEALGERARDNYHTVLIAKNHAGIKELNSLISRSTRPDHFYYVNRISFDEFLQISENIIKISACLASPLSKLELSHDRYEELVKHYDYLEIQHHDCAEQKDFNVHLAVLSEKYNKPLIAGTDTHSLDQYKADCRGILMKAKKKSYSDEDKFDLTYKTYDELVEAYRTQGVLPENLYLRAIQNTVVMADSVEDFELDRSLKYPILYGTREKDKEKFDETISRKFEKKVELGIVPPEQVSAFEEAIAEERRVFSKIEMDGFMLSMSELTSWCYENGIPIGFARGSVGGSRVAYVTDITDVNPERWHTVFSRFCNEDRKEVGDIDIDVMESDRPKIFNYIIKRFGKSKTARVSSFGKIIHKGTIGEICRGLKNIWAEEHPEESQDANPYSVAATNEIKSLFDSSPEQAKKKYPEVFYYFDGLVGTRISQSVHPAGMVISPITLDDNYGTFDKDGEVCLMLDMKEVHKIGLVKYDFLILKNVEIIKNIYDMIGKPYPKSHEIDWEDEKVWADMLKSPTGIFQMEGEQNCPR